MLKRAVAIAALLLTGCSPYKAPRISVSDMNAMLAKPDAPLVVDVRSKGTYWREHIKGAIDVSWDQVRTGKVPWRKDRWAILYCA